MQRHTTDPSSGHSPVIEMTMDIDGLQLPVMEVGPDFLVVQSAHSMSPVHAMLTINVDERTVARRVFLPEGIRIDRDRQPMVVLETHAPTYAVGAG